MGYGQKTHLKRSCLNGIGPFCCSRNGFFRMAKLVHFPPRYIGGKRARIDRRTQIVPKMTERPNMVFMGMRDEYCFDLIAAFL